MIGTFCGKKVQNTRDIVAAFSVLLMAKVPKPSACRFRGNNLRPALSGRSKNKTMQPPAPGTRAVGCSCSAASENADFSRRVSRRTTRQSKTAISTFCDPTASGNPRDRGGARASVSVKSVAIFRSGTRFATFGLVVPGKIVTFESYLFKPIERCSNACSRLRPSSIKRG